MSPRQSDIADMKCWLLRLAQKRWRMPAVRVAQLFSEAGVYDYVTELYDLLHLSSYERPRRHQDLPYRKRVFAMLALRDSLILYHGSYASAECLALEGGSPMGFDEEAVTDEQHEACAVVVIRTMLEDWCDDTGAPFDDALDAFASSRTYELLFDFSSRQWAEGPDNLRFVWEQEKKNS